MTPSMTLTRAIRTLAGVVAIMAVLLAGIAIGLYSTVYLGVTDRAATEDGKAESSKTAGQNRDEGLSNPVMHLDPDTTGHEGPPAPCKPQDQTAGATAGKCGAAQPSVQGTQKLLVMLLLWRAYS